MPVTVKIEFSQPCHVTVSHPNEKAYRANITRVGKPDLDAFGPTPFDALYEAVLQDYAEKKGQRCRKRK